MLWIPGCAGSRGTPEERADGVSAVLARILPGGDACIICLHPCVLRVANRALRRGDDELDPGN